MKPLLAIVFSALFLGLAACALVDPTPDQTAREVVVQGRTWVVFANADKPNGFIARRDNNNLNPFGRPATRRTLQAVAALEAATGCKVIARSLWQTPSADFYADMTCPQ